MEGDYNYSFFHSFIKSKNKINAILAQKMGEIWIERVFDIKREVVNHFTEILKEPNIDRPRMDGVVIYSLSDDKKSFLSTLFTL